MGFNTVVIRLRDPTCRQIKSVYEQIAELHLAVRGTFAKEKDVYFILETEKKVERIKEAFDMKEDKNESNFKGCIIELSA